MAVSVTSFGGAEKDWRKDGSITNMFTADTINYAMMLYGYGSSSPARYFNMNVRISDWTTYCDNMFAMCTRLNSEIVFGNNVTSCSYMFYNCELFNQPINMPETITSTYQMFGNCRCFNSPITIAGSNRIRQSNTSYMFYNCINFNQPVPFMSRLSAYTDMNFMFADCIVFNQPVEVPDGAKIFAMLDNCSNFNSEIIIHDNCNANQSFYRTSISTRTHLDMPITIGSDCMLSYGFKGNFDIRGNVTIGRNSTIYYLFTNDQMYPTRWMNSDTVYIGARCFMGSVFPNYGYNVRNLFIEYSNMGTVELFYSISPSTTNPYIQHNIYYNNAIRLINNSFNNWSWTAMANGQGYYNSSFNVYIFNGEWPINIYEIEEGATNCNYRFEYLTNFNVPITIPNTVRDTYRMFYQCNMFNQPVNFPITVNNMEESFMNCFELNEPIIMPVNGRDCKGMFSGCTNFNQPIDIPCGVNNFRWMFSNCTNFNSEITMRSSNEASSDIEYMMFRCFNFNQPFTVPRGVSSRYNAALFGTSFNSTLTLHETIMPTFLGMGINVNDANYYNASYQNVTLNYYKQARALIPSYNPTYEIKIGEFCESMDNMFAQKNVYAGDYQIMYYSQFNGYVNMDGATNLKYTNNMFNNCYSFNRPVNIPSNVIKLNHMFNNCIRFNQPVMFGDNYDDCGFMFNNCTQFNQPVILGNNYNNCSNMFSLCSSFNQPITFGSNIKNCSNMFYACSRFNQPVNIKEGAEDLTYMFRACSQLNSNVVIPQSATTISYAFYECSGFSANIYVKNDSLTPQGISGMLRATNNSKPKYIYCNNTDIFTNSTYTPIGTSMVWVPTVNGYYSSATNIFVFNNMPEGI